jgi:carbamate kinase
MLIVAALGGNAVSLPGKEGNIADQYEATRGAIHPLANLILAGHQLAITHGNGPQIGQVMRRVEIAASSEHRVYPLPLDIAVADTQAGMGYMIGQCLMNELALRGEPRVVSTLVTTVLVDPEDSAFKSPSKPVGPFMSKDAAEAHVKKDHWNIAEDKARGGWRRVVPSPSPREIIELPQLRTMLAAGHVVVAGGGGGIPVARNAYGMYKGIEAVIDKDRTTALLAAELDADLLAILTNVDQVQVDYGKPTARALDRATASQMSQWLAAGQFPAGSMGPKVEAAVDFLSRSKKPDAKVLITSCERVAEALAGKTGTWVTRG